MSPLETAYKKAFSDEGKHGCHNGQERVQMLYEEQQGPQRIRGCLARGWRKSGTSNLRLVAGVSMTLWREVAGYVLDWWVVDCQYGPASETMRTRHVGPIFVRLTLHSCSMDIEARVHACSGRFQVPISYLYPIFRFSQAAISISGAASEPTAPEAAWR